MNTPEADETTTVADCPPLSGGLGADAELIAFERICTDLLSLQEGSRSRILKAAAILLGLEI